MRVAFVYDAVYPYVKGGVEKRVYEVGKRLVERGHEVHWYGIKWWEGDGVLERDGIVYHGVCRPLPLYTSSGRRSILEALWFSLSLIVPLWRDDFELIDCQNFPYLPCFSSRFVSFVKGSPLVITWHEVWGRYWGKYLGFFGFFGRLVEYLVSRLTKNNVAVSENTRRMLAGLGVKKKNIAVVPNGVDLDYIKTIKPSSRGFSVLFVGRLIREKNVDLLVKAFSGVVSRFPEATLGIVGGGPERGNLESLVDELGLGESIEFLGFQQDHGAVIAYMKSCQVFVSPSTREGFSIAVLEALACGIPVLITNHESNAARELIEDGVNGFAGELSADFFSNRILRILSDNDLGRGMSKAASESAKKYNWHPRVEEIEGYYEGTYS